VALWTKTDVRNLAPEMALVPDATVDLFISFADGQLDTSAVISPVVAGSYLTAHMLKLSGYGNNSATASVSDASGPVTSITVGKVSVSFADVLSRGVHPSLAMTRYGILFDQQVRLSLPSPFVC
jgi:hypothetical protein